MLINNAKLIESLGQGKLETILTKLKNPPVWGPFDYERYEEQVLHWDLDSKDSELNKFNLLLNEFNRKKEIPGSVIKIVHNRTNREGRRIKKKVEVLRDKFTKTFVEKTKYMIEKMMNLVNKNADESGEQMLDNFYSLVTEFEKIE